LPITSELEKSGLVLLEIRAANLLIIPILVEYLHQVLGMMTISHAAVVFPVTLSSPIILGMLISFLHRERIRPADWVGVSLGVAGILILSLHAYLK
jgi:drug/metabolite transporter (DMT)-like permease